MNCDRVQVYLNGYVDGELDIVTSLDIEEHLQTCAACSSQRRALESLHVATSDRSLYHPAPAALEKRIRTSLKKMDAASGRRQGFAWQWLAPAVALIAILVLLAGFFGRELFTPNPEPRLALEVQNAHVRSLMAEHLMDVASSNQHTVKPWFNGKLDFSPPVADLSAQGFPLIGGRLDYIDGRAVAALVYQSGKHKINLFIWPSLDKPADLQSTTNEGYNLFHWTQSGMTFWAISDLNAEEMMVFIRAVQASPEYPK